MKKSALILLWPVLTAPALFAAKIPMLTENRAYEENIKSVTLAKAGLEGNYPIISLNGDQLQLDFDDLNTSVDYFMYTFIHCDAGWNPTTTLQPMQYIQGNQFENINNSRFPGNTFVKYVHYTAVFPTEQMKITKSGNYILKVYRNYDENDLVLTRRFMVVDHRVKVHTTVKAATFANHRFSKQEVDVVVDYTGFNIPNPFQDVTLVIQQNGRLDNINNRLKPMYASEQKLTYNYEQENLFAGGNEFRSMDLRTLRMSGWNVEGRGFDSAYIAKIRTDEPRGHLSYLQYADYNGKFSFNNRDTRDAGLLGDYARVQFSLESPLREGEVHILGELTNWMLDSSSVMTYDAATGSYSRELFLKQGIYNYEYVIVEPGRSSEGDLLLLEGSHSETENDYTVLVYHRNQQGFYDELIGYVTTNSRTGNKP